MRSVLIVDDEETFRRNAEDFLNARGYETRGVGTLEEARAFGARSRAMVERGEKPPHRAVMLIHGEIAAQAMANTARGLTEGRIIPIELAARKRP